MSYLKGVGALALDMAWTISVVSFLTVGSAWTWNVALPWVFM